MVFSSKSILTTIAAVLFILLALVLEITSPGEPPVFIPWNAPKSVALGRAGRGPGVNDRAIMVQACSPKVGQACSPKLGRPYSPNLVQPTLVRHPFSRGAPRAPSASSGPV